MARLMTPDNGDRPTLADADIDRIAEAVLARICDPEHLDRLAAALAARLPLGASLGPSAPTSFPEEQRRPGAPEPIGPYAVETDLSTVSWEGEPVATPEPQAEAPVQEARRWQMRAALSGPRIGDTGRGAGPKNS